MKRFVGLVLAGSGAVATLWGGFHVMTGQSTTHVALTDTLSVTAMMGGLIGVLLFTVGLIWVRD